MIKIMLKSSYEDLLRQIKVAEESANDYKNERNDRVKYYERTKAVFKKYFSEEVFSEINYKTFHNYVKVLLEETKVKNKLAEKENEALSKEIKELHSQIEYKEQKIKDSTNTLESIKNNGARQIKHFSERIEELKELNKRYAGEKGGLTKENHKLKARIEELEQNIKNMSEELTKDRIQPTVEEYDNRLKFRRNKEK